MDLRNFERARQDLRFRGVQGTVGTQVRVTLIHLSKLNTNSDFKASFLQIFQKDHAKVEALNEIVTKKAGFDSSYLISSQTYTRKIDVDIAFALASFSASCQRFGGDIRHLGLFAFLNVCKNFEAIRLAKHVANALGVT